MSQANADACLRCGSTMASGGVENVRIGGTSGGWHLLFGALAELDEGMLPLEMLACPTCRLVEFRRPA